MKKASKWDKCVRFSPYPIGSQWNDTSLMFANSNFHFLSPLVLMRFEHEDQIYNYGLRYSEI